MDLFQEMNLKARQVLLSGQYIPFNKRIRTCKGLSELERRLIESLLHSCGKSGAIYPKISTLMLWTNYSKAHVIRGLHLLESRQLLRVDRTARRNKYYVNFVQLENVLATRRKKQYRPFSSMPQLESDLAAEEAEPVTRRKTRYVRQDAEMMKQMFAMVCHVFSELKVSKIDGEKVSKVGLPSSLYSKNLVSTKNVLLREPEQSSYAAGADAPADLVTSSAEQVPLSESIQGSAVDSGSATQVDEVSSTQENPVLSFAGKKSDINWPDAPFLDKESLALLANSVCVQREMPDWVKPRSLSPVVRVSGLSDSEALAQAIDRTLGKGMATSEEENRSEGKLEGGSESSRSGASVGLSGRHESRAVGSPSRAEGSVKNRGEAEADPTQDLPFSKSAQTRRPPKEPKSKRQVSKPQATARKVFDQFNRLLTELGHKPQKIDAVTRAALLLMIKNIGADRSLAVMEYMARNWEECRERDERLLEYPNLYNITAKWRYQFYLSFMHSGGRKAKQAAEVIEPTKPQESPQEILERQARAVREKKKKLEEQKAAEKAQAETEKAGQEEATSNQ